MTVGSQEPKLQAVAPPTFLLNFPFALFHSHCWCFVRVGYFCSCCDKLILVKYLIKTLIISHCILMSLLARKIQHNSQFSPHSNFECPYKQGCQMIFYRNSLPHLSISAIELWVQEQINPF